MAERGGQLGNNNAAKEKRLITDELRRVVTQGPEKLKQACQSLLNEAAAGNIAAFNVIADRLDGKPAQRIIGDDDEPPIQFEVSAKDVIRQFIESKS